jgi:hypothetical protein
VAVGSVWNYGVTQMFTWREGRKRLLRRTSTALRNFQDTSLLNLANSKPADISKPVAR